MTNSCLILLTKCQKTIVDKDDYEDLIKFKWQSHYDPVIDSYYAVSTRWDKENKKYLHIRMHREIMNCPKGMEVDHINGNKLDNRKCNLRICTRSENMQNRKKRKNTFSKLKGAYLQGNRWCSSIMVNRKKHYLGCFGTEKEAHEAYKEASIKYHGEFSCTR